MSEPTIDIPLLRKQRDFLLEYAWRDGVIPEEVDGLINLLDYMLDVEEGHVVGTA